MQNSMQHIFPFDIETQERTGPKSVVLLSSLSDFRGHATDTAHHSALRWLVSHNPLHSVVSTKSKACSDASDQAKQVGQPRQRAHSPRCVACRLKSDHSLRTLHEPTTATMSTLPLTASGKTHRIWNISIHSLAAMVDEIHHNFSTYTIVPEINLYQDVSVAFATMPRAKPIGYLS